MSRVFGTHSPLSPQIHHRQGRRQGCEREIGRPNGTTKKADRDIRPQERPNPPPLRLSRPLEDALSALRRGHGGGSSNPALFQKTLQYQWLMCGGAGSLERTRLSWISLLCRENTGNLIGVSGNLQGILAPPEPAIGWMWSWSGCLPVQPDQLLAHRQAFEIRGSFRTAERLPGQWWDSQGYCGQRGFQEGQAFSASWLIDNRWIPFLRGGCPSSAGAACGAGNGRRPDQGPWHARRPAGRRARPVSRLPASSENTLAGNAPRPRRPRL